MKLKIDLTVLSDDDKPIANGVITKSTLDEEGVEMLHSPVVRMRNIWQAALNTIVEDSDAEETQ